MENENIENFFQLPSAEKLFQIRTQRACFRFLWDYLSDYKREKATELMYLGYKIEYAIMTKEE